MDQNENPKSNNFSEQQSPEEIYETYMGRTDFAESESGEVLDYIGKLTDLSLDLKKEPGLRRTIECGNELRTRILSREHLALSHYFTANGWSNLKTILWGNDLKWQWEIHEMEKEIYHLRSALNIDRDMEPKLPIELIIVILTNLANLYDTSGRFVESLEYYNKALDVFPDFAMAKGNKALTLCNYASCLYDKEHQTVILKYAYDNIEACLEMSSQLHPLAKKTFEQTKHGIEYFLPQEFLSKNFDLDTFSLGESEQEIQYRKWVLDNKLFLNPLNDLGSHSIACRDILTTPDIVTSIATGPIYVGLYNQMKQEFVSSRYLYFESINSHSVHFSDKGVLLYDTLDYPAYSLSIEKMKIAFRMAYSILDKIAYFLNEYFELGIEQNKVSFSRLWYMHDNKAGKKIYKKQDGLTPLLKNKKNIPLKGLFWISRDIFDEGIKEFTEPDAQELNDIRNHLEHKYFKLHNVILTKKTDELAYSMHKKDFDKKVLRVLKIARAALMYLSLAVHGEENERAKDREPNDLIPPIILGGINDEFKQ